MESADSSSQEYIRSYPSISGGISAEVEMPNPIPTKMHALAHLLDSMGTMDNITGGAVAINTPPAIPLANRHREYNAISVGHAEQMKVINTAALAIRIMAVPPHRLLNMEANTAPKV